MPTSNTRGVSIRRASMLLKEQLPEAPARITLQRHAKNGMLNAFVSWTNGKSKLYDLAALSAFYKVEVAAPDNPSSKGEGALTASSTLTVPQPHIDLVAEISKAMAPLVDRLNTVFRQSGDLLGLRNTLMLKYDAAATVTQQRLDQALAEIADLKRARDLESHVTKLRVDVARLTTAVERLLPPA